MDPQALLVQASGPCLRRKQQNQSSKEIFYAITLPVRVVGRPAKMALFGEIVEPATEADIPRDDDQ